MGRKACQYNSICLSWNNYIYPIAWYSCFSKFPKLPAWCTLRSKFHSWITPQTFGKIWNRPREPLKGPEEVFWWKKCQKSCDTVYLIILHSQKHVQNLTVHKGMLKWRPFWGFRRPLCWSWPTPGWPRPAAAQICWPLANNTNQKVKLNFWQISCYSRLKLRP